MAEYASTGWPMAARPPPATIVSMRRIVAGAALAGAAVLTTGGCGTTFEAEEVHAARSFPFTGAELRISTSLGGLRVLPGTSGKVEVERWVRGKAAEDGEATWSLRDGTLRLSAHCTLVFGDCGARYHVRVPPSARLSIDAQDGVILNDLTQDADVSTHGRIQVSGSSGALRLKADDQSINGSGLKSADVIARTRTGMITLTFTAPPQKVDLRSRHGRVTTTLPRDDYKVTAESVYGSEHSDLTSTDSPRDVVARSESGDVRVLAR